MERKKCKCKNNGQIPCGMEEENKGGLAAFGLGTPPDAV
jgi:hypothetical protein